MLRVLSAPSHGSGLALSRWPLANGAATGPCRSLTTKKSGATVVKSRRSKTAANSLKAAANPRALVTSAQILPDGFVKPALYDENTPIPRCEAYPSTYHMGSFPWLLSAERQRTPVADLDAPAALHSDGSQPQRVGTDSAISAASQLLPRAARHRLAHALNMRIARAALGPAAVDDICAGAAAVLPRVASLLSRASSGDTAATGELEHVFTHPLLSRYTRDLERLRNDHVQLALEVHSVDSARVHQVRTQTGPAAAFAALDGAAQVSSLRAGLTRQTHRYTSLLGATHAAPRCEPAASWASAVRDATNGRSPVQVRVDVELMVGMRYRLVGRHTAPSKRDRHNGTTKVIVDDDATRSLMLTLESSIVGGQSSGGEPSFSWRVADIDYLLSSERRIESELDEARCL
ncbi:hypothetical protein GGF46_003720 [Coemansia sp. RSA 552]|nr:hypothetical protein GGF46_003720 [Coemansia sp. RSA 552]